MHYHLILTELCNSQCKYCYEKSMQEFENGLEEKFEFDFSEPDVSVLDLTSLKNFLAKDKNAVLIFYGGEPLLESEKIKKIIDEIDVPFRMQTNAKTLDKLPIEYVKKISKILVSIDGDRQRTDYNRGKGTFDLVVKNLKWARENGYKGEFVARMTLSEFPDLFEQVKNLLDLGLFDSIHWQLDVGFYKFDYNKQRVEKFLGEYNQSLSKLADFWISEMKKGKVIKIYPFIAIIDSLLKKEKTLLRCGAGHAGYAISTTGKLVACPIMNCIKSFEAGNINTNPAELKKFDISKCKSCSHVDLCGGRCLYWRSAELWPQEGDDLICKSIKHYLDEMKRIFPEIQKLIENKNISAKDFEYEKYFGPEIIP